MLEIIFLIYFGKKLANLARSKGRSGALGALLGVGLWLTGEVLGITVGMWVLRLDMLLVYGLALVLAVVGAVTAYAVVVSLAPAKGWAPVNPLGARAFVNAFVVIVATIALAIVVNVLSNVAFFRVDLTENEANSLSDISEQAVEDLEGLEVKVYISDDLPETIRDEMRQELVLRGIEQKFRDTLEEYRSNADGNMKVTYVTEEVIEKAKAAKVRLFSGEEATATEEGQLKFKQYALGASFHYKNVMEVFPLALYPEHYEFELTRILLRLKSKAEKSLVMKDALRAGKALRDVATACNKRIETAEPKADAPTNPFGLLSAEQSKARLDAYKAAVPDLQRLCNMDAPLEQAKKLKGKHRPLDNLVLVGNALTETLADFAAALSTPEGAPQPPRGQGPLQQLERLKALARAVETEYDDLEDSPGRKSIGFVCSGQSFCPFPSTKPLIPPELAGIIGQKNPIAKQVAAQVEQMTQRINMILGQIESALFRRNGFNITRVDLAETLPSEVEALVLFGPQAALSEYELYKIDQFVLKGGSLVVFLNPWDVSVYNIAPSGEMETTELARNSSNIGTLLTHWGVAPRGDLVLEPTSHDKLRVLMLVRQGQLAWQTQRLFPYPMLPLLTEFDDTSPLVRSISSITLPFATSLELKQVPGITHTALIATSTDAVTTTDPSYPLDPQAQLARTAPQSGGQSLVVAAVATGDFKSYYAGKDAPDKPKKAEGEDDKEEDKGKVEEKRLDAGKGRVLVIGSNLGLEDLSPETVFDGFSVAKLTDGGMEFIEDFRQWAANFQNWEVRLGQIQHTLQDNLQFMFNALDWGIQQEGLVAIRSKQYTRRPLEPTDEGDQSLYQVVAIGAAPLLFVVLGLGLWFWRRSRRIVLAG